MWLKNLYRHLSNWINYYYTFDSVFHRPQKNVIHPGYWVEFNHQEKEFLNLCAASFNYETDYSRGYRQKEITLFYLSEVTFLGNSGALVKDNKVIKESVFDQLRLPKSPAFRSPALMVPLQKSGKYTSLMHLPWAETSNYHWFLDCLPRLYALLITVTEPITLIIPTNMPAFQQETLGYLIQNNPFISLKTISKKQKWRLAEFLLPTFISNHYSGYLPPEVIKTIRTGIWNGYGVKDESGKSRIYVSRVKASKRRLLNEEEVLQLLRDFDFITVYAEDLTYAQQVQLFYNARVVVGGHGAGLTNILFGRDLQLIELQPADLVRSHYFMICKALNFDYHYVLGSPGNHKQDFRIEPDKLKMLLENLFPNTNLGK